MKNKTNWRVIGYGDVTHGFFNQFHFCSTLASAQNEFQNLIADPEMDGAVLIEVKHETWRVIRELGTYPVSVCYSALGTFKVKKAPEYVLV